MTSAPKLENDEYEAKNPVADAVHSAGRNVGRFFPPTMRAELKRQNEIFNEAAAVVIDEEKIPLLIPEDFSAAESDGSQAWGPPLHKGVHKDVPAPYCLGAGTSVAGWWGALCGWGPPEASGATNPYPCICCHQACREASAA